MVNDMSDEKYQKLLKMCELSRQIENNRGGVIEFESVCELINGVGRLLQYECFQTQSNLDRL